MGKCQLQKHESGVCTDSRGKVVLRRTEKFLFLAGVAMLVFFSAASIRRVLVSRAELKQFRARLALQTGSRPNTLSSHFPIDFSLWSAQRVASYQNVLTTDLGDPLAVLRISRVRLEVPVLEGVDESALNRGVGHISGTALPGEGGTVGIAGHRDGFFRVLKDVGVGDIIELETGNGTYQYRVSQVLIVDPIDVSVLQPRGVPSLTLVTCYPFYFVGGAPKRYIVEASIVSAAPEQQKGIPTVGSSTSEPITRSPPVEATFVNSGRGAQNPSRRSSR
jgi:sortase A